MGNLQSIAATTDTNYTGCSQESGFSAPADRNNHLFGLSYDLSGNTQGDGTNFYTWDAESQLKTAAGVTDAYDGDGRRVSKSNGKLYWYGSGGEILAETDAAGNTTAEYIFFGSKRIAMLPAGSTPIYYVEDMLHFPRHHYQHGRRLLRRRLLPLRRRTHYHLLLRQLLQVHRQRTRRRIRPR